MSRKSSGRQPTAHERALWDKVVEKATPLAKRSTALDPDPGFSRPEPENPKNGTRLPDIIRPGQAEAPFGGSADRAAEISGGPGPHRMDRKQHGRMTRGKLEPEARIDLHGMTLAAAQPALTRFILTAHAEDRRLVLVITGKGKDRDDGGPIPTRTGILRHQVPAWLQSGPLAGAVLDIAAAHRKHGGSGAYYVYLRRRR